MAVTESDFAKLAAQLAQEAGIQPLSDARLFKNGCFSGNAYRPATSEREGWVEAWSQYRWLPLAEDSDPALHDAWMAADEVAFKIRAEQLLKQAGSHDAAGRANQQTRFFVRMRKGDVVFLLDKEPVPKTAFREFSLGIVSRARTDLEWVPPSGPGSVIGPDEHDFDWYGAWNVPFALRRAIWVRHGNWNALRPEVKTIASGYCQTCTEPKNMVKAALVLAEMMRLSTPLPSVHTRAPSPHSELLASSSEDTASSAAEMPSTGPSSSTVLPSTRSATVELDSIVIGERIAESVPVAHGELLLHSADASAHETVEVHQSFAAATVKTEGSELGDVRLGTVPHVPHAVVQPVLVAHGSSQASRIRSRQDDTGNARRRRRLAGSMWETGYRVSYNFIHDRVVTPFTGTIKQVHAEYRMCDVDFDDGTLHRVEMSKLTRL
jgi:hypothetical protein